MDKLKPGLARLRDSFVIELRRHRKTYDKRRPSYPDLDPYPTPESLLALFADTDERLYPHKERITAILLAEYLGIHEPHPLWSALLVLAYFPMLARLRRRVGNIGDGDDAAADADQAVIQAFLDVLDTEPLLEKRGHIALRLRQATERRLFAQVKRGRRSDAEHEPFDEDAIGALPRIERLQPGDPDAPRYVAKPLPARMRRFERTMHRLFDAHVAKADLDLVLATLFRGEDLWDHVDREHPSSETERAKIYERLKRQRTRTVDKLRGLLGTIDYDKSDYELYHVVQTLKHGDDFDSWEDRKVEYDDADLDG